MAGFGIIKVAGFEYHFAEIIMEEIFSPLNMTSSGYLEMFRHTKNRAYPHQLVNSELIKSFKEFGFGACAPAGSIVSNIEDLSKWIGLHLNKGRFEKQKIFNNSSYKKIFTPYIKSKNLTFSQFKEFGQEYRGLAWELHNFRGEKLYCHGGGTEGFNSFLGFLPDHNYGLIVLTNSNMNNRRQNSALIVACYLLDILASKKSIDWQKRFLIVS